MRGGGSSHRARAVGAVAALAATLALGAGCAATPVATELQRAEALEAKRDERGAIEIYDAVLWTCEHSQRRGRDDCGDAASRKALLLERSEPRAAFAAWLVAVKLSQSRRTQARAVVRAATIAEELGDHRRALQLAWQAVDSFPDEMPSEDALRLALRLDERTAALAKLRQFHERFARQELGDDLLYAQLPLLLDGGELDRAVAIADDLWRQYPRSSLRDDAMWKIAQALRAAHRPQEALRRLQLLLDTRRDAYLTGSYNSEFLDDAQLEKGRLSRDDLHDDALAIDTFSALVNDWPESRLRDDAQIEWARTVAKRDKAAACRLYAEVPTKFPDGNQRSAAEREQAALGCPTNVSGGSAP